jgi:hypothetical protein
MDVAGTGGPPSPEEIAELMVRSNPPENEIPVVLPWSVVLGRAEDVVAALIGVRVYTTGVELDLVARMRGDRGRDMQHPGRRGGFPGEPGQPLLGVEFADGQFAVASGFPRRPRRRSGPALHPVSGSMFGPNSAAMRYYLTPLPPPGPMAVHFAWPALDLPENSVELDGGQITAVLPDVAVLWPPEPPPPPLRPEPEPHPDLPEASWFGRALRRLSESPAS